METLILHNLMLKMKQKKRELIILFQHKQSQKGNFPFGRLLVILLTTGKLEAKGGNSIFADA